MKVALDAGCGVRKAPSYPGVREEPNRAFLKGHLVRYMSKQPFEYTSEDGSVKHEIMFYELMGGGWIHDYNKPDPSVRGIIDYSFHVTGLFCPNAYELLVFTDQNMTTLDAHTLELIKEEPVQYAGPCVYLDAGVHVIRFAFEDDGHAKVEKLDTNMQLSRSVRLPRLDLAGTLFNTLLYSNGDVLVVDDGAKCASFSLLNGEAIAGPADKLWTQGGPGNYDTLQAKEYFEHYFTGACFSPCRNCVVTLRLDQTTGNAFKYKM